MAFPKGSKYTNHGFLRVPNAIIRTPSKLGYLDPSSSEQRCKGQARNWVAVKGSKISYRVMGV